MLKREPVRGMRDIMPDEARIRASVLEELRRSYSSFGFNEIETPILETIGNLSSNNGGENEKLVFKVMKRGDKLEKAAESGDVNALADSGLRYDLTLPLTRYYAAHASELPQPFKAMQIGSVFRADRPQRGRFRQFTQCDIDIFGDATPNAEIELISATTLFLQKVGIGGLRVAINDRRILFALVEACGFPAESAPDVLITLDKYDKIGIEGVCKELESEGYKSDAIAKYEELFTGFMNAQNAISYCEQQLGAYLESDVISNLQSIIEGVATVTNGKIVPELDISLVRGMGYYTGSVFEITSTDFEGASIAGGGRYDKMVGKYTGQDMPACGFSIGFERIVPMLMQNAKNSSDRIEKIAVLYDKNLSPADVAKLQSKCQQKRESGSVVAIMQKKRNIKHQREGLEAEGYSEIFIVDSPEDVERFAI